MANDFKNAIKTGIQSVETLVYTSPNGETSVILEVDIANTTLSSVTADVIITDSSASVSAFLLKNAPIPHGSTLQAIQGQKVILESLDSIKVVSNGTVDVVVSVLEDIQS
jgi:hypothetical protein